MAEYQGWKNKATWNVALYIPVFFCYRTSVDKPQHLSAERRKLPWAEKAREKEKAPAERM